MTLEVCVDSYLSAVNAEIGGASRLELCSCLSVGGLTPSIGLLQQVKETVKIPVNVLIRPRASDFLYSEDELCVMIRDIVACKKAGADGFVLGALTKEGSIDEDVLKNLLDSCQPLPVTFHRAIDMCRDIEEAVNIIQKLGCRRILSSGQHVSALEGRHVLKKMIEKANGRLLIMAGGGITPENISQLIDETGCDEYHASASILVDSAMTYRNSSVSMGKNGEEYSKLVCDAQKVRALVDILKGCQ